MRNVTLEELLEAGCHFGHQVTRHNPKARDYIFEARDNIHIIDLAKTKEGLDEAAEFVKKLASQEGSTMIILGAKKQAQPVIKAEAERMKEAGVGGLYFVSNRWIGGILTNFGEVSKNFKRLKDLATILVDKNARQHHTKKELSLMDKERAKLDSFYWGIADMPKNPDALFIVDTHLEQLAVREALATGVTTVGITDTNADPTLIKYAIPANDDAVGSIELIVNHIVDAWIEGKTGKEVKQVKKVEEKKETVKAEVKEEVKETKKETVKEVKPKAEKAKKTEVKKEEVKEKKAPKKTTKKA